MLIKSLPLCSRCAIHEISSWFWEKTSQLDPEILKQVSFELKAVKLRDGECLVCSNKKISEGCIENIIKILEKNKASQEVTEEFVRLFAIQI